VAFREFGVPDEIIKSQIEERTVHVEKDDRFHGNKIFQSF
jgi:hypothetical protein